MDELKVLLDGRDIEYSETELVINEDGVPDGPPNSTIENLNSVFVSLIISWLRNDDVMPVMSLFQDENSRIFIVAAYEPLAREIICEVCDTVIHTVESL